MSKKKHTESMYKNNRYYEEEQENKNSDNEEMLEENNNEKENVDIVEEKEAFDSGNKKEKKNIKKEIEELKEKIEELEEENKKLKDTYLRTLAETDNFKKRIDDERIRERKYQSQRLLEKLVSFTDIFDKACNAKYDDPMMQNFLLGFKMISDNIQNILSEEGVKKIKIEKMFDPKFMQAMEVDYDPSKDEGEVLQVLKEGYMYKDRVLVYALVKVNKKPVEETPKEANESSSNDATEDK